MPRVRTPDPPRGVIQRRFAPTPQLRLASRVLRATLARASPSTQGLTQNRSARRGFLRGHTGPQGYQEGRGVGLAQKIQSIALEQQKDCDTAAAFAELGHPADPRKYDSAIQVLKRMGISKITLDTSNPNKISALEVAGIHVEHISLPIESNEMIDEYRKRKRRALGHHG